MRNCKTLIEIFNTKPLKYQSIEQYIIIISRVYVFSVPPMIWIQNQLIGSREGQQLTLECHSEAYPKSINYWTKGEKGEIIAQGISIKRINAIVGNLGVNM